MDAENSKGPIPREYPKDSKGFDSTAFQCSPILLQDIMVDSGYTTQNYGPFHPCDDATEIEEPFLVDQAENTTEKTSRTESTENSNTEEKEGIEVKARNYQEDSSVQKESPDQSDAPAQIHHEGSAKVVDVSRPCLNEIPQESTTIRFRDINCQKPSITDEERLTNLCSTTITDCSGDMCPPQSTLLTMSFTPASPAPFAPRPTLNLTGSLQRTNNPVKRSRKRTVDSVESKDTPQAKRRKAEPKRLPACKRCYKKHIACDRIPGSETCSECLKRKAACEKNDVKVVKGVRKKMKWIGSVTGFGERICEAELEQNDNDQKHSDTLVRAKAYTEDSNMETAGSTGNPHIREKGIANDVNFIASNMSKQDLEAARILLSMHKIQNKPQGTENIAHHFRVLQSTIESKIADQEVRELVLMKLQDFQRSFPCFSSK